MKRKFLAAGTALAVLATGLGAGACTGNTPDTLRLGTLQLETSALIIIAEERGFFADNRIEIQYTYYETGLAAANGMLKGDVDIAGPTGEYAAAGRIFAGEDFRIIGAIDKVNYMSVVARRDRGIASVADLRGKKIGVIRGTQQEFYLTRFLELNGIPSSAVSLENVSLAQSITALANGDIDAVILVPPYIDEALDRLGANGISWPAQSSQFTQQLILCQSELLTAQAGAVERFVKALAAAADYAAHNPDDARSILKQKLALSDTDIARIWSQNLFSLTLDQSLVSAMEDEARWMISNKLTNATTVPDFLDYIHEDTLKKINPDAVRIIR